MQENDTTYFALLKMEIANTLRLSYPSVPERIEEWKGQTITYFQEDLLEKQKEHVSERWFYNHMKSSGDSLPRIDILNLLSRYVGFKDWADFKYQKKVRPDVPEKDSSNRMFYIVPLIVVVLTAGLYAVYSLASNLTYNFCFISADDLSPVSNKVQMEILSDGESPKMLLSDSTGCIQFSTDRPKIRFVVRSPYYKADTITRTLNRFNRSETLKLMTDDFALMLYYFSTSNVEDWNKRRMQLDNMLADSARIYEVFPEDQVGVELFDKEDFIAKLTTPSRSLKQIEILDAVYKQDKIVLLRFTQNDQ